MEAPKDERERKERFNEEKRKEKCIRLHIDTKISRVAATMILYSRD